MAVNTATVAARQRFGQELKRVRESTLRDGKRVQQIDVAKELGRSTYHRYSQIERGQSWPKDDEWQTICEFLRMDAVTKATLSTMRSEGMSIASAWWTEFQDDFPESLIEFIAFEDAAARITTSAVGTIPALLQTAKYALAWSQSVASSVLTVDQLERSVSLRRNRRTVLERPRPATLEVIISEAALTQEVGGRSIMVEQLDSLIQDAQSHRVTYRIIPRSAPATVVYPMHLLEFAGEGETPIAVLDSMTHMLLRKSPKDVREARYYLDAMRALSVDPMESMDMIRTVRKEMSRA
ncbi:helix-turn-helix transcriptional regulator [Streptomyces sp. NPDC052051]|uniref:helix-turn-helix domain-containing protein n=1 Tax=Streptomyces sp. NPDC052051 TaxID=3154649 RepID=UPI003445EC8C